MHKKLMIGLLMFGLSGGAWAQSLQTVVAALDTAVINLGATGDEFAQGNVNATASSFALTVTDLSTDLASGTPLEPLALQGVVVSRELLIAGQPLFDALEEPADQFIDATQPLGQTLTGLTGLAVAGGIPFIPSDGSIPLATLVNGPAISPVDFPLPANAADPESYLTALQNFDLALFLNGLATNGPDAVTILLGVVGMDGGGSGLALAQLPLPADALDPTTLTALLGGASLPGL